MAGTVAHPLVDYVGPDWAATATTAPVIWLSQGRIDLLMQCARQNKHLALVSHAESRLTEPSRELLTTLKGRWVVRANDNTLYDGMSGHVLPDVESAFHPHRQHPWHHQFTSAQSPQSVQLIVSWSIRYPPEASSITGQSVETFIEKLGGDQPTGWGPFEPVTQPWDTRQLTKFVRTRMPGPIRLVIMAVGHLPMSLTLTVQRTRHGIEELVTGLVSAGPWNDNESDTRLAQVIPALGTLCSAMPLFAMVWTRGGRSDLTHVAHLSSPPMPVALLIGPPAIRSLELKPAEMEQRFDAISTGRKRFPTLIFPLMPRTPDDTQHLSNVIQSIDPVKFQAAMGPHLSDLFHTQDQHAS